ncbi:MAG: hypothetical protein H6559_27435 [Lewinellaceae bacterium]|nr:hypothetical protein [Lewinellaceae bacterium]
MEKGQPQLACYKDFCFFFPGIVPRRAEQLRIVVSAFSAFRKCLAFHLQGCSDSEIVIEKRPGICSGIEVAGLGLVPIVEFGFVCAKPQVAAEVTAVFLSLRKPGGTGKQADNQENKGAFHVGKFLKS